MSSFGVAVSDYNSCLARSLDLASKQGFPQLTVGCDCISSLSANDSQPPMMLTVWKLLGYMDLHLERKPKAPSCRRNVCQNLPSIHGAQVLHIATAQKVWEKPRSNKRQCKRNFQ